MSKFNWVQFHKDLDVALATYIVEVEGSIHHELITFLEFSNYKQLKESLPPKSKKAKP